MKISPDNGYTKMQKAIYAQRHIVNAVTGEDHAHEQHRADYRRLMFEPILDTTNKVALDFAYGHGRTIEAFHDLFARIDGVDLLEAYADLTRKRLRDAGIDYRGQLFTCNGVDLSIIDDEQYDVVYTMISLHHIPVYDIRRQYLEEFFRVLKPGGHLSIQMFYSKLQPRGTSRYLDNQWNANNTNGGHDVWIGPGDIDELRNDLEHIGFEDFSFEMFDPSHRSVLGVHERMLFIHARRGE